MDDIQRFLTDEGTSVALGFVLKQFWRLAPDGNNKHLDEAARKQLQDMTREAAGFLAQLCDRIGEGDPEKALRKISTSITEDQAQALMLRLLPEAIQSLTRDRVRLLAAALAGLMDPDIDMEMKSRVARTIQNLEPSDILQLRAIKADTPNHPDQPQRSDEEIRAHRKVQHTAQHTLNPNLQANACIRAHGVRWRLTNIGDAVLQAVQDWKPAP